MHILCAATKHLLHDHTVIAAELFHLFYLFYPGKRMKDMQAVVRVTPA